MNTNFNNSKYSPPLFPSIFFIQSKLRRKVIHSSTNLKNYLSVPKKNIHANKNYRKAFSQKMIPTKNL